MDVKFAASFSQVFVNCTATFVQICVLMSDIISFLCQAGKGNRYLGDARVQITVDDLDTTIITGSGSRRPGINLDEFKTLTFCNRLFNHTPLRANESLNKQRAKVLTLEVVTAVLQILDKRLVTFEILDIIVTSQPLTNLYGITSCCGDVPYKIVVSLYGVDEQEYLSTLCHELAHSLCPDLDHDREWLKTCACLMTLFNDSESERTLCASVKGINIVNTTDVKEHWIL